MDAAGLAGAGDGLGASGVGGAVSAGGAAATGVSTTVGFASVAAVGAALASAAGGVGAGFGVGGGTGSVAFGCSGAVGAADGSSIFRDRERSRGTPEGGGGAGAGGWTGTCSGASTAACSTASAGPTLGALTNRGGPNRGRIAGSAVLVVVAVFLPFPEDAAFLKNRGPVGRLTSRSRASRSANCRATISSTVLEALFTSMPCSRLRRSMTSWLGMPSTSATM